MVAWEPVWGTTLKGNIDVNGFDRRVTVERALLGTGNDNWETDVEAMKAGAADYLVKGHLDARLLERSIRYALERTRAQAELEPEIGLRNTLVDVALTFSWLTDSRDVWMSCW